MAGEIQVNSITALTESGSNIVLNNVNSATNRTNLGLGSIATQAADSVNITGGTISSSALPTGTIQKWEHVTTVPTATQGSDVSYTDVTGSSKDYTPATNSSYVVYEYLTTVQGDGTDADFLPLFKLIYDGSEVANTNHGFFIAGSDANQGVGYYTMKFVLSSWSGSKNIKLQYRAYNTSRQLMLHKSTVSGDGSGTDVFTNIYQITYSIM